MFLVCLLNELSSIKRMEKYANKNQFRPAAINLQRIVSLQKLHLLGYTTPSLLLLGGGPRVVVSTGVRFPVSAVWKKQNCFFPIHVWKLVLWGASVTER